MNWNITGKVCESHFTIDENITDSTVCLVSFEVPGINKTNTKLSTMDIADTTRKFLRPLGYLKNGQYSDIIRFTCLRIICTISCLFIAMPAFWRIIFEVEVFAEKIKAILAFICGFTAFMFYVIILLQRQRILTMFDILQMIALARRTKNPTLNRIYKNANVNFAKLLQMCDIGMFRFSVPSFVLPIMIYSFFEYYGLQNSDESFQLAFSVA